MKGNIIDLKSVKLNGSGLEAKYVLQGKEVNLKCKEPVHSDLREAINRLIPFLVDICEFKNDDVTKFSVSGITISGSDNTLSVQIIGHKLLESVKTLHVNSPRVNISTDGNDLDAVTADRLREIVQDIVFETEAYVIEGKYAVKEQSLPFKDNNDDPFDDDNG